MPDPRIQVPQGPDIEWQDLQFPFNGQWMPSLDPSLIGPNNFATLTNFRYNDGAIEGIGGYARMNETNTIDAGGTYIEIRNGIQLRTPTRTTTSRMLVHAVDTTEQGRVYQHTGTIDGSAADFDTSYDLDYSNDNAYWTDSTTSLKPRFSQAPQQSVCYCNAKENMIFSGDEQRVAAAFLVQGTPTLSDAKKPKDYTKELNNAITTDSATFSGSWGVAATGGLLVMTTRPIQAMKIYVQTANTDYDDTITVKTWTGSSFGSDLVGTDNTIADGQSLRTTGIIEFSGHTNGTSKLFHFNELYLFAYLIQSAASALDAEIYQVTVDMGMQPLQNIWDGVYRQPIQCQIGTHAGAKTTQVGNKYSDYTLHVNQSSDTSGTVGLVMDSAGTGKELILMFEEPMAGARFVMAGSLTNNANAQIDEAMYWDGNQWQTLTFNDGTLSDDSSFSQTGLISWNAPTDEVKSTIFGSVGYAYSFRWDAALDGSVTVDLIVGVPEPQSLKPFKFSAMYQNRLMLGGFTDGGEGNRMDYCVTGAPDVWNGTQSSRDGLRSLYFGQQEPLTGAAQVYNRFGASVFSMLMVFKDTEVYMLTGNTPSDFTIYPVSDTVGCPAPNTIATAEVGFEVGGQGLTRNVVIWISHYGPMMFDGAIVHPLQGIGNYFDPEEGEYINWDYMDRAHGWVDQTYKEYNLLIPSGTSATDINVWLVYDLIRKKWYKKDTAAAPMPQAAWNVMDPATGEQFVYGGNNSGYLLQLEEGTSWNASKADTTDGTGIEQVVKTGDFFPSNSIWDWAIQRKLKVLCQKLPTGTTSTTLQITSWGNAGESGSNVIWKDNNASAGINVDFTDMDVDSNNVNEVEFVSAAAGTVNLNLNIGTTRIIRLIKDLNEQGWVHAWEFSVTTTDAAKGWQPLYWGIQYYVARKDNMATQS